MRATVLTQPGDGQTLPERTSVSVDYGLCAHRTREDEVPARFKWPTQLSNGGCHPHLHA